MSKPTNYARDLKCPSCAQDSDFQVDSIAVIRVTKTTATIKTFYDGSDGWIDFGASPASADSYVRCASCDYEGTLWEFTADARAADAPKEELASSPNCRACSFCSMEPDDDRLICGHPDAGPAGLYMDPAPAKHCGPNRSKFKQHPMRNANGDLTLRNLLKD